MLKGMTGYGRATADTPFGHISVEIASLNRRHLEVTVATPLRLGSVVPALRDLISNRIGRGQVKVTVAFHPSDAAAPKLEPNLPLIEQLRSLSQTIAEQCQIAPEAAFSLAWNRCADLPLLTVQEEPCDDGLAEAVLEVAQHAMGPFCEMKRREGEAITREMDEYLSTIEEATREVERLAEGLTERYRVRLQAQVEEMLETPIQADDEGIAKQVVIHAAKSDIAEEVSRLRLHAAHLRDRLKEGQAKPLEFLLQEMLRETNTIGSKAADGEIVVKLVELKSALERMREQMHNVE